MVILQFPVLQLRHLVSCCPKTGGGLSTFIVLTGSVRDQWAKNGSANPDIKVYIGALAGLEGSGYVDSNTLAGYITRAQRTWQSFGGIMLWEASLAVGMAHDLFFYRASSAC